MNFLVRFVEIRNTMLDNSFLIAMYIFVLAFFAGFEVITKVPPTLHTPLMSGANAISGIALVGALIVAGPIGVTLPSIIGVIAIILATINVVGGFMVTDRMLQMFRKKEKREQ
jgi:NAD(P) transhydrogenase subunit alpha